MVTKDSKKLKESLKALIDKTLRENSVKLEKYWYPLSVVTFDLEEIISAVESMCAFRTSMGEKTLSFENAFANRFNHEESVMVNSGSSADLLIAFALINPVVKLLSPGDEVLVPSVTWPTQVWSLMMAQLKIKFVDINPNTFNMDIDDLKLKISSKTRAISLVHLMGNPCNMDKITAICKKHNLILVEDCCEAMGAKFKNQPVGTFGLAGSYSFFFSHHITTMEGGMIGCKDKNLSDIFRMLRAHGWGRNAKYMKAEAVKGLDPRYMFLNWGFNVRPTELQASFGIKQLNRLPAFNVERIKNAAYFQDYLKKHTKLMRSMEVSPDAECAWFAFPIILSSECPFKKEEFLAYLEAEGVETRPVVTGNLTRQPVCQLYPELRQGNLPGSDAIHDRGFYIGVHPFKATKKLDRLAEIFERFIRRYK